MERDKNLVVCMCFEEYDNYDILLNRLGHGDIFGRDQLVSLLLQGSDTTQLEGLCWDVQDCAFPLIADVSIFDPSSASQHPDIVLVLLADSPVSGISRRSINTQQSPPAFTEHITEFSNLLGLVQYTSTLDEMLAAQCRQNTPIVLLGDLAHVAASLLASRVMLSSAGQVIALHGEDELRLKHARPGQGQMSKTTRFCHILRHWWTGTQANIDRKVHLGTKFVDVKQNIAKEATGYFFSAPVDISGPGTFTANLDLDADEGHLAKVKMETDMAHSLAEFLEGSKLNRNVNLTCQKAHL
ncbi:malate dehydrogenase [Plakobranchus ocellatus]|uniref:Malate dehydrogenase n=1 Tax=Plakobranchus ocellatus TaxID=259542 RepID=A0AAV4CSN4_9GAST|nr:malate dehydrogenase [Plakobranchus ocellatus]